MSGLQQENGKTETLRRTRNDPDLRYRWINNDVVNLACTLSGALLVAAMYICSGWDKTG
jgi:uncharacterized membrane protein